MNGKARVDASPVVVVQARTGSTRLPGKVLAELAGLPVLGWLLERVRASRLIGGLAVATSTASQDDAIVELCDEMGVPTIRGEENDVLSRYRKAASLLGATHIVRLTADCPLLDGAIVDAVVDRYRRDDAEMVENVSRPGWPVGTAVEVLGADLLQRIDRESTTAFQREHVTQIVYDHPERYDVRNVEAPERWRAPGVRLCIDTPEDLRRLRRICEALGSDRDAQLERVLAVTRGLEQ